MDVMAEQMRELVVLISQQVGAITALAPALTRSTDELSECLRTIIDSVRSTRDASIVVSQSEPEKEAQPKVGQEQFNANEPPVAPIAVPTSKTEVNPRRTRTKQSGEAKSKRVVSTGIVVKSIADTKRPDRFYTAIRMPRTIWDRAGFEPNDRLLLDWTGKALIVERAGEGGVKPKSVGDTVVVLQSWKLGNLNLDQPKVTGANASLRVVASAARSSS
jgi:hypothetical protein